MFVGGKQPISPQKWLMQLRPLLGGPDLVGRKSHPAAAELKGNGTPPERDVGGTNEAAAAADIDH